MRKNDNLTSPPRTRTSVAISGLDRSTPDDMVKDGACEELHNLRYKDNAWRPVNEHKVVAHSNLPIPTADTTYNIVYKHPAAPESHYIVERKSKSKYYYYDYDSAITQWNDAITLISSFDEQQKVSHFGNVLFIGSSSFLYRNSSYVSFNSSTHYPTLTSQFHTVPNDLKGKEWLFMLDTTISWTVGGSDGGANSEGGSSQTIEIEANRWYNLYTSDDNDMLAELIRVGRLKGKVAFGLVLGTYDDLGTIAQNIMPQYYYNGWCGEHAMFAALRMKDGTTINNSPVSIGISNNDLSGISFQRADFSTRQFKDLTARTYNTTTQDAFAALTNWRTVTNADDYKNLAYPFIWGYEDIDISIPVDIDLEVVDSVSLYSTRVISSIDLDILAGVPKPSILAPIDIFSKDNITAQPFYRIGEKRIRDCVLIGDEYHFSVVLDSTLAETIATCPVYSPLVNNSLSGEGTYDYNNRLHIFNTSQTFTSLDSLANNIQPDESGLATTIGARFPISNVDYVIWGIPVSGSRFKASNNLIISAHDYRVDNFLIHIKSNSSLNFVARTLLFPATASVGNNLSSYVNRSNAYVKYSPISILGNFDAPTSNDIPKANTPLHEPNRLQVSSANNPFSLPFENSYAIGSASNRIIALQSAAIEMSDAKFGEFPLFAFTDEGIFALQAGSETLYASIIPINYDKIINPNTLAINGGIIYITERGVHLLAARGDKLTSEASTLISSPIHGKDGRPPLDFLRTCQIMWPKEHNEVIFHNPDNGNDIAYVFNLDAGYWSTRTLVGTKINTDEMVAENSIYDLTHEDASKTLVGSIVTRPIKLGNVEYKRVDTIIPRMSTGPSPILFSMVASGAVDGSTYHPLREVAGMTLDANKVSPIVIRRTPFSAKYFKLAFGIEAIPEEDNFNPSITHIDFEWYTKFQRRMR